MAKGTKSESACPNCGYCPHCGRSNQPYRFVPYNPYPWPYTPYWVNVPTTTITTAQGSDWVSYTLTSGAS